MPLFKGWRLIFRCEKHETEKTASPPRAARWDGTGRARRAVALAGGALAYASMSRVMTSMPDLRNRATLSAGMAMGS